MDLSLMDQACFNSILILYVKMCTFYIAHSTIVVNEFYMPLFVYARHYHKKFCTVCFLRRSFVITLAQTVLRNTGLWKRVDTHGLQWQIDETPASGLLIGIRGILSLKTYHLSHVSVLYLLLLFFFWGAPLGILWDSYLFRGCPSIDSKKEDNKSRSELRYFI